MNQTRRVFTTEFKQECVRLIVNGGYGVGEASKAMNVGLSTLQRWLRQYRNEIQGITPQSRALTPEQQHIQALEAENRQLMRDNDLLKKASAFFAIEMQSTKK